MKQTIPVIVLLLAFMTDVAMAADTAAATKRPAVTHKPVATARKAPPSGDGSTNQWSKLKPEKAASATQRTETVNNNESVRARVNGIGNPVGLGGSVTAGATASQPAQGTQGFTSAEGRSMSFELVAAPKPDAPPTTP